MFQVVPGATGTAGVNELTGRRAERDALGHVVDAVRAGRGPVLVIRGDPGAGKTALLEYLAGRACGAGCRLVRAAGVQTEMELAFAGLHQLCRPMLSRAESLPGPQRDALRITFGLSAGPPPNRFLLGLAVLNLLGAEGRHRPLVGVIDDQQWLDRASAQVLGFVARRLRAEPVGLVFAVREPGADLAGLPELEVGGLPADDARMLLDSALTAPLDERVRDLIVAESHGNPLALLELPRGLGPAELAGGFGLPSARPLAARIEDSFARQLAVVPADTRQLLQLAAADQSGDPALVRRLGIGVQAEATAMEAGLATFGVQVTFRHPLARSAAYRSVPFTARQQLHAALAEATDPVADPDRRAWHRAEAAPGPDELVAAELERSAGRAQARGGLAAAAAFLGRSVLLTPDPQRQAGRALAAAQASMQAGSFGPALGLLATASARPPDELASARADLLRGQIAFARGRSEAAQLLLRAARRLEPLDPGLARETYVNAWIAASAAGQLSRPGEIGEISRAARALPPPPGPPRPLDLLLDGFARLVTDGPAAAAATLRQAASAFASADIPSEQVLQYGWVAATAASVLWDLDTFRAIVARQVELARSAGALERLPVALVRLAIGDTWRGDLAEVEALMAEARAISETTQGSLTVLHADSFAAALRGDQAEVMRLTGAAVATAEGLGQGVVLTYAHWATAILHNGQGRYADARAAAEQATRDDQWPLSEWARPELIEAAVRTGETALAAQALDRLTATTQAGRTDFGLGVEARSRALLSSGDVAEGWYREAISRLGRTRQRPDLARAHLLYGEWLRREHRRADAGEQLRTAHGMLTAIGMMAFAERAWAGLAGPISRRRPAPGRPAADSRGPRAGSRLPASLRPPWARH